MSQAEPVTDAAARGVQGEIPVVWAEALAPITYGVVFGGRTVLEGFERGAEVKLRLRDIVAGRAFAVRLRPRCADERRFASAGRMDVLLDLEGSQSPSIEHFVRALAARVLKNTAAYDDARIAGLFLGVRETAWRNPYLRLHSSTEGAQIDLLVGSHCNETCVFCTDINNRGWHLHHETAFWLDALVRAAEEGRRSVTFVGNEPTLRTDLPTLVAEARRLGFLEIQISTNGVRFSERAYLAELLDAGANVLAVSAHGADADMDGRITGRPDFHARRRRGFENFAALVGDRAAQARKGIYLRTITVLTPQNLDGLPAIIRLLDQYQVTHMLFHYPWVTGGAELSFKEAVPTYAAVTDALTPLLPRLEDPMGGISLGNLPLCVMTRVNHGRMVIKNVVSPQAFGTDNGTVVLLQDLKRKRRPGETESVQAHMDPSLQYGEVCTNCAARSQCPGVSKLYLEAYGSLGLRPIE